ncbi:MAG: type II secretion system protein GspD [Rhodospirillaceae bacterium]
MSVISRTMSPYSKCAAALSVASLLASCAGDGQRELIPAPMHITKPKSDESVLVSPDAGQAGKRDHLTASAGIMPPLGRGRTEPMLSTPPPKLSGEPVSVKFEGIRLAAFINTVFGDILNLTYEIDNSLTTKDIMVTLSTAEPLSRDNFYRLVTEVLSNYGVSVIYANNVYRVVEASTLKKPIPRIIRTRGLSSMPGELRPVFYFQPLNNIQTATMTVWLELTMKDRVQTVPLPLANGLLLLGNADDVTAATEIIQTLDQPYLAGTQSLKLSPAFWSAQKLAAQLVEILTAEGYSIGIGGGISSAVKLIPVEAQNIIIAFGTGQEALQHVLQWAQELDQPSQTANSTGAFYHQVYNAKAKDIVDIVKGLVETTTTTQTAASQGLAAMNTSSTKQKIMVDEARNGIIFTGTAEEYAQFRSLVQQMDRAPLQVMIEATIAEVNLKQGESLGMVFNFAARGDNSLNQTTVKSDGTGIFFSLIRDHGSILSQINALSDYNRLQILSSPRLVTSSGKSAAINVGTQVPIITTQESSPTGGVVGGNTSILQSIQYRNTGIILNINPTINSNRRVELTVSQEVSDAQQNNVSGVQSPIIINRSLQTTLSLDNGQTAILGGMISDNYSKGNSGIPYLKDIPILGNLFKNQSNSLQRTELIVLLTPYIIDSPETAAQVRDAFRTKLGEWAAPPPPEPKADAPVSTPHPNG